MTIKNRLLVEYVSSNSPWNCCSKIHTRVSILNKELTDKQIIELVILAGFDGQQIRVTNRTKQLAEGDKYNYYHIYDVETLCDSSD